MTDERWQAATMLAGRQVRLRPVRAADLDALYDAHDGRNQDVLMYSLLRADPDHGGRRRPRKPVGGP